MTTPLLIHWTRDVAIARKSFDSMRVSANIERLTEPAILFLDLVDPFLVRGFPVLLNALSSKKLIEFRFVVDFSHFEEEQWRKSLERSIFFLKEKNLPFVICEKAHPSLFDSSIRSDRWYKKSLMDAGHRLMFVPFVGEYEGKIYPDSYDESQKIYFEFQDERLAVYQVSNLESDDFLTPAEKLSRFFGQKF